MIASARRILVPVAFVAAVVLLSGCAANPNSATIRYTNGEGTSSKTFTPRNITCDEAGLYGTSFPEKPYIGISVGTGVVSDYVSVWILDGEQVSFESDEATVATSEASDGSIEYRATATGQVAVTDIESPDGIISEVDPDVSDAKWYDGSIEVRIHCTPEQE